MLKRHWESVGGRSKTTQIVLLQTKAKELMRGLHGRSVVGHLRVNEILDKVRQLHYFLHASSDVERCCRQCNNWAASRYPWTQCRLMMHRYNVSTPIESIAIKIAGTYRYFLTSTNYFTQWPKVYAIPNGGTKGGLNSNEQRLLPLRSLERTAKEPNPKLWVPNPIASVSAAGNL